MERKALWRITEAAQFLGVHRETLREWTRQGRVRCLLLNERGDRRYELAELTRFKRELYGLGEARREVIYARVSGSSGQESSLDAQVAELGAAVKADGGVVVQVLRERASALNENRRGLARALELVRAGKADTIRVTHQDRLTRFGFAHMRALVQALGGEVIVQHEAEQLAPEAELLADFMSLIACFSGRLYGLFLTHISVPQVFPADDPTVHSSWARMPAAAATAAGAVR